MSVTIGVLALQGAFAEHISALTRFSSPSTSASLKTCIHPIPVKTCSDLLRCEALIIPGGESTTMALLARLNGLLEPLRDFVKSGKPVWGTCAGAILLANGGGQELLGGVDISVERNGWGSQLESFETELHMIGIRNEDVPFRGVFIRAPLILSLTSTGGPDSEPITILSRIPLSHLPNSRIQLWTAPENGPCRRLSEDDPRLIVALRQGRKLVTTFHPELTLDDRILEYFVKNCVLDDPEEALDI
ncbi:SNO glutamine amidotransferase [Cantharellus anzutake]|uniref:SNO glutamine amidotransferase n=1 Tax=Cantharellus anzutake TaxID=1750568 RepID=UPI0019041C07|nr:SNO glutamine amidotransferase [Cantharellus anzutake]KAF8325633.1 SNO glutamine amidotransferase [Cantharellus anzutake]